MLSRLKFRSSVQQEKIHARDIYLPCLFSKRCHQLSYFFSIYLELLIIDACLMFCTSTMTRRIDQNECVMIQIFKRPSQKAQSYLRLNQFGFGIQRACTATKFQGRVNTCIHACLLIMDECIRKKNGHVLFRFGLG